MSAPTLLNSVTTPLRYAQPLLNQEGSLSSVRPGSLWRGASAGFPLCLRGQSFEPQMDTGDHGLFEVIRGNPRESAASAPPCLRGDDWLGRLGRSPLQGSGLMGVPLTQAVGLGFVRSPLWGSKTWAWFGRTFRDRGLMRVPLTYELPKPYRAT